MCYHKKLVMSFEGKLFWQVRHSALPWLFQVLETPVLLGLINW